MRQDELTRLLAHNATARDLAGAVAGRLPVAHFDFDFASDRAPWMFNTMASYEFFFDKSIDPGSYLMHLSALGTVYRTVRNPAWRAGLMEETLSPYYKPYALSVPVLPSSPVTVGVMLGVPGYQVMTVGDPLDGDAMPAAVPCDLEGLVPVMTAFAGAAADSPALSLRAPFPKARIEDRLDYRWNGGDDYDGIRFMNYSKSSSDTEGPPRRAVLVLRKDNGAPALPGVSRYPAARINADGYVSMPLLNRATVSAADWVVTLVAFGFDPEGRVDRMPEITGGTQIDVARRNLFYAYGGGSMSCGFAPELVPGLVKATTLNARTDSRNRIACTLRFAGGTQYYTDKEGRIKVLGANGELLLGSTPETPMGEGVPLERAALLALDGISQGASDYWFLNENRLKALRERHIVNDALETLHAESREHLDEAVQARTNLDYSTARAHEVAATCLENRVYSPLRGITDDLVKAVVILLLIAIPFAFALERLVFGFTSIYKQVLGFAGFFLATFLVLFLTHPAFALASAPIVIFLAFVIILLSGITIAIVMSRIRQEIRAIQGLASTVHGADRGGSTGLAAVLIGISGMRNRPLKTFLTAMTVLLLTFTILVFASFTSELGVVETYLGKGQDEERIELHRFSYLAVADEMVRTVQTLYGARFHVFRRGGLYRNPAQGSDRAMTPLSPDRILLNRANGRMAGLGAVFGVDAPETGVNARLGRLLPGLTNAAWAHPPVYLSEATAAKLGVRPGDEVMLIGRPFTFAGVFSGAALQEITTIDSTKIVPPDFEATVKNIEKSAGRSASVEDMEDADAGSFGWFSPDRLAIADLRVLEQAWPNYTQVNFVTLYPRGGESDLAGAARDLAVLFRGAVHVKSHEGARRLFFTRAVAGSGFSDVIVPLLLGGLIIFSSLMGSIVDREREIFTYSALGLAPPDVGALFFAESAVYSVLGGMGGYLLGLVVANTLTVLGTHGYLHAPGLNVSALSSVMTILIVMAVVMLSTIYPALKAGKSANPGVTRQWRMPAPEGDLHRFVFPFTVSAADFAGILSFIREHFENHGDATLGNFAARKVELFRLDDAAGAHLGIRADVSLAPFDLGVFQEFRMYSREFNIPGIEEVVVELERRSGAPGAWLRGNRVFVEEMRQQFLLWRSLPISTVEHYRRQTAESLGEGAAPHA